VKKIKSYLIIEGSDSNMIMVQVLDLIHKGYHPLGPVSLSREAGVSYYCQAVVSYTEDED